MPPIDLKEKRELMLNRADIIALLGVTPEDALIINDIVDDIESQVVDRIKTMGRVTIPRIGSFFPNEGKLDAMDHHALMKEKKKELTPEEYKEFKRGLILSRVVQRRRFKSRTTIISRTIRFNKVLAKRKLKQFGRDERGYKLYMYFFSKMKPVNDSDYYINLLNREGYDCEDFPIGFKWYD